MYSIYVHTFPDGKKYVGMTSQNVENRWQLGWGYKDQKNVFNAINSVGWNNIQHDVIETVEDKKTALKREEYYTLLFRSNEPEFGYNILAGRKGVGHIAWNRGIPRSQETKQKISEKNKGRKPTEEEIKNLMESKKKPFRIKNKKTGSIYKFDYQKDCADFFGVCPASVCYFLNGTRKSRVFKDYKVLSK